jgi:hypothetical protein
MKLKGIFFQQLNLVQRFQARVFGRSMSIALLNMNTPNTIIKAVRANTRFSEAMRITLQEDSGQLQRVFLTTRYFPVFTDSDILKNYNGEIKLLMYHGRCERSGAFNLSLQRAGL